MNHKYKLEFSIENPDKKLLDLLFPYRSKQVVKKDIRKHCIKVYDNLSMKNKLLLVKYWGDVLRKTTIPNQITKLPL
ncbi:Uncharacterised protein [Chryseobacterium nakagawai]|uniref:Uncharacterized protein n=1 Tax=Chryseobacterium nakagawai TaxID=1241982 RepID=A0AAD0YQM8_CHRNA|nr:hypothetical protein [Chryseobacterium nakagawai]AZA93024.1 hypothetical protein EG343_21685 [Chryseobacterium nakagawai]VEH19656.1 Uncharacterised protein [Chryseobacterium nakagawai]